MTSQAIRTQGTRIEREDPSRPYLFLPIGGVTAWDGPGGKANLIDITNLASRWKEKLPGLLDEGGFNLTVNFDADDAGQAQLMTDREAQILRHYRIIFTDAGTAIFSAYVMDFKTSGKLDDKVEIAIGLEIIGLASWTPPSQSRWVDGWPDIDSVADWDLESTRPLAAGSPTAATASASPPPPVPSLEEAIAKKEAGLDRLRAELARLRGERVAAE